MNRMRMLIGAGLLIAGCTRNTQMTMTDHPTPAAIAAFIDSHWDYDDPETSESRFRALLATEGAAAPSFTGQVQTQIARAQALQRRFDDAHATLDDVETELDDQPPLVRVRYLLERGRTHNSGGQRERSVELFEQAWTRARSIDAEFYAVDAAHMLGIVMPPAEALRWNRIALDAAERSSDERAANWVGSLCNNIGWTHHGQGEHEQAMAMFERALQARLAAGKPRDVQIARWCVARCHRSLGNIEQALAMQRELLAEELAAGDGAGYTHEEIAECLLALGREDEARPHFAAAYEELSRDPWLSDQEPERLARMKQLGD